MVFETLVADLMNRYLGDFVENLNKSQLSIGIWGGDVVLNNLYVKESALDDLDLPIKVAFGNIGRLVLKVPWKNLYTEPTIATLEGLYIVAVPNAGIKYNEEKEKKTVRENKQKELAKIERAKKAEAAKNKPTDEQADSFAEKLATNVIKNLQVEVKDIHIRYEDEFTNPEHPFAVGITLRGLHFQTTDDKWNPTIIKETVSIIHKLVELDSLSLYWNSNSTSQPLRTLTRDRLQAVMQRKIASLDNSTDYQYLIEPITSIAKLKLNTKPELDNFSIPKVLLKVVFEEIAIGLTRAQYLNVVELLESLERMSLASKYRKYRPSVGTKGHEKLWWRFAYTSILEETVKRRRKMWSWRHIKQHRQMCKTYKHAYKKKLSLKKIPSDLKQILNDCERELTVFNITLVRNQAELEAKKEGVKKEKDGGGGWFGGWFGGGRRDSAVESADIGEQFQKLMSDDEKAKLYEALGYEGAAGDPTLPTDYVANKLEFQLNSLSLSLKDEKQRTEELVRFKLTNTQVNLNQRPAASAIRLSAQMENFSILGAPTSDGSNPELVSSQISETQGKSEGLLDVMFETNPMDGKCDARVRVNSRPLEAIYDASTVNQVAAFFKPPEYIHLAQLQSAALSKLEEIKEQTATGLQHVIEHHKYTDIAVDLKPTYVLIPENGVYQKGKSKLLVIDLGTLKISSIKQDRTSVTPSIGQALDKELIMQKAYDKFNICLRHMQLLYAKPGEDWQAARQLDESPMHVLRPMGVNILLYKAFMTDIALTKIKVSGELPSVMLSVSDQRLEHILTLAKSIPLPKTAAPLKQSDSSLYYDAPDTKNMITDGDASRLALSMVFDSDTSSDEEFELARDVTGAVKKEAPREVVNVTDLELQFEIKEICLVVSKHTNENDIPLLKVVIDSLGAVLQKRTYDLEVTAYLGGIYVQHMLFTATKESALINLVNTPTTDDNAFKLLTVKYVKADKKVPQFSTLYNNTEQKVAVKFSALEVLLHQEAILNVMRFAQNLQKVLSKPRESTLGDSMLAVPGMNDHLKLKTPSRTGSKRSFGAPFAKSTFGVTKSCQPDEDEVIDFALEAELEVFALAFCTQDKLITDIKVKGLEATVNVQRSQINVRASLHNVTVYDPTVGALYPKILTFENGDVFNVAVAVYNGATDGVNYSKMSQVDLSVQLSTGAVKIVFLNKYVASVLQFVKQFQFAMDRVKQAGRAAAGQAADAAKDFSHKATRLKLDIKLKAPVVIVPQHSKSNNAVVADLGNISVSNSFTMPGKYSQWGMPAVLDTMDVQLSALKLSRATMMGTDMQAECLLLDPVNIQLTLVRNLAASWYHGHPDIDVAGHMHSFVVALSQGDYTTLMGIISDNLKEGAPPPAKAPAVAKRRVSIQIEGAAEVTAAVADEMYARATSRKSAKQEVYAKVKFDFTLKSIKAELFKGNSNLATGVTERDPKQSLGAVQLQTIGVEGSIKSNGVINAAVQLHRILLEDTRPGRDKGITRMIEQASYATEQSQHMIDVEFTQQKNDNKNINVKVNGLYICVCLEYLLTLADFFTKTKSEANESVKAAQQAAVATATTATTVAVVEATDEVEVVYVPAKSDTGELNLLFTMDKPEIILVENAMNPDTNALILELSILFKLRMTAEMQNIMANVSELQIISCLFCKEKRDASKALILNPTDISLMSSAPQGKGHHVDINVGDIIMNISPATIRTITATLSSMTPQKEESGEDKEMKCSKDLWNVKPLKPGDFWFLKTEVAEEAVELEGTPVDLLAEVEEVEEVSSRGEQLVLQVKRVIVKLEGGVGKRTVPLIITEMSFHSEVKDWTSKLYVTAELALEVAYYNEGLAVWEPLIEPVEHESKHRPWEISLQVMQNDIVEVFEDDMDVVTLPPPKMTINVKSNDVLQATITKTGLDVITKLGKAFGDAYNLVEVTEKPGEVISPYVIKNHTGRPVTVRLDDQFEMPLNADRNHVSMNPDDVISLQNSKSVTSAIRTKSVIKSTQEDQLRIIHVIMEEFGATRELRIVKAEKRAFNINQKVYPGETWQFVSQVDSSYGTKTITLRSVVQMKNHLPFAVELYYKLSDDSMARCGEVQPEQVFSVPLDAVYAAPYELYFKPHDARYSESKTLFNWKQENKGGKVITCEPNKDVLEPIYFRAKVRRKKIWFESTGEQSANTYMIHLYPCVRLRNHLPFAMSYVVEGTSDVVTIAPGDRKALFNAKPGSSRLGLKIDNYMNKEWTAKKLLEEKPPELSVLTFVPQFGDVSKDMDLGVHSSTVRGCQELAVYCPYWMLNKTERNLTYKAGDETAVTHVTEQQGPVLFSFKAKSFFGKKKASLKVSDSEWSDKFSLDTVGSSGTVTCKFKGHTFEVGVHIQLASGGLTKIVTFTPYFMIINQAQYAVCVREPVAEAAWCDVQPGQCVPFWPVQSEKIKTMIVKVKGEELESTPFSFIEAHTTLLQLDNKYGGINAVCQPMESAVTITLQDYKPGFASVLLINHTTVATINYVQSGGKGSTQKLRPGETVLYTWQDVLGKRELTWSAGEKKNQKNDLVRDDIKDFYYTPDNKMYWVSFLDGMQRILLFTEDNSVALTAQQAGELERLDQEINLSLKGVGLSLVNNKQMKEIAYMSISSSGVIWEERKKKRFKALKMKQSILIENAYEQFVADCAVGKSSSSKKHIEHKLEVDFGTSPPIITKPKKCEIRRSFESGVSLQYRTSGHQLQFHMKIHRLQLDNQMPGAVFPTVLAPTPLPKSVAADSVPRPFTEMSVMIRKREYSKVMQFKYFKILVQEMAVKVDQGFINALLTLFSSGEADEETKRTQFKLNLTTADSVLMDYATQSAANEQKHFYDMLHISPLKVHLSFSMYGGDETEDNKPTQLHSDVLNLFLQSVGIVLTDIQDVIFKLGYFEREFNFYNKSQLTGEVTRHYSSQAIKQMYVLVLGLDVLGNPFGVIRGLATGIEDLFYEPYQGAIQGPEEFAEGLALGVKSLLGHAVGGAAGAVSRITGALGKGIATLTLDDEYQKKRREQLNKKPEDLKEGLARGGKGLVMGVFDGVTGIVRKPVEGAKEEGVGGFFKGVGKGLVGVVTRPASGVVDFASSSFEGVKRLTDLTDEVRRLRPPRFLHKDGIVRPYLYLEAEGNDTLQDVEKGKYATTDQYVCHTIVTKDRRDILLVTDNRVIFATKGEIFGHWDCAWTYTWDLLREPPTHTDKGIQILLKEKQKKGFFSAGTVGKMIPLKDRKVAQGMVNKMREVMEKSNRT